MLWLFLCRSRDLAAYTELIHVFLVGCRRLPLPQQYHGGAVVKALVIEIRLSRFCNYFCCAVVHVSATGCHHIFLARASGLYRPFPECRWESSLLSGLFQLQLSVFSVFRPISARFALNTRQPCPGTISALHVQMTCI